MDILQKREDTVAGDATGRNDRDVCIVVYGHILFGVGACRRRLDKVDDCRKGSVYVPCRLRADDDTRADGPADLGRRTRQRVLGAKGAILGSVHGFGEIHGPDQGMLSDNNDLGLGLIMVLPLIFYHWHLATNRHIRRGLMVFGFLVTLGVLLTYSRGALLGVCAMGTALWLRSRAKFATGFLIAAVVVSVYNFAPRQWTQRMESIQNYDEDGSATGRINMWKTSIRIAELHPLTGGGFRVTFWPEITNDMLRGTDLPRLTKPRATHSIYFDVLSEQGWIGLTLFLVIIAYSFANCAWLIRRTRGRPDLAWANLLGRMGQAVLVGYATAGAFASQAYLDEYWCIIFIFDAARRLVAREVVVPAGNFAAAPWVRPRVSQQGIGAGGIVARSAERVEHE